MPPYDHPWILTGQGTAGLEIAEQAKALGVTLDAVAAPCSGGGLATGVALGVKGISPTTTVHAGEPAGFDDLARSLATGTKQKNEKLSGSICDALLAPTPGDVTFPLAQQVLGPGLVVTDDEVLDAMELAFREFKLVLEPGGAVALAAALTGKLPVEGSCRRGRLLGRQCRPCDVQTGAGPRDPVKITRRNRREWRIILWVILTSSVVSAYFGYSVAPSDEPPLQGIAQGILTSLLIATPIVLFEVRRARFGSLRWLRRLPLIGYFAVKVLFYFVVIVAGLILSRVLVSIADPQPIVFDAVFRNSLMFSIGMALFGNLVIEMGRLLGYGTLKNLLLGRYVRPRREQKVFLLIDMKNSTGLAEKLGPIRFHELLNDFFRDIADAALECDAEIHKYVGDEAILTWPKGEALTNGDCLACPFVALQRIADNDEGSIAGASTLSPSSARRCIMARSSPVKSAMCVARSPMSATR